MTSWRDHASQQAQEDLDGLLDLTLSFAQQQLAGPGEILPYAALVDQAGELRLVAVDVDDEMPRSTDVIDACVAALTSQRSSIRACAVVAEVRVPELGGDAVRVELEHADGHAIAVLLPYARKASGGDIEYGPLRGQAGSRRVWT